MREELLCRWLGPPPTQKVAFYVGGPAHLPPMQGLRCWVGGLGLSFFRPRPPRSEVRVAVGESNTGIETKGKRTLGGADGRAARTKQAEREVRWHARRVKKMATPGKKTRHNYAQQLGRCRPMAMGAGRAYGLDLGQGRAGIPMLLHSS